MLIFLQNVTLEKQKYKINLENSKVEKGKKAAFRADYEKLRFNKEKQIIFKK